MDTNIKLNFEFGGKKYEAEPKGWVRLPDGTQFKVTATDGDGNATVEKNGKKGLADTDVSLATEVVPETPKPPETPPGPTLADLKARWEAAQSAITDALAEQALIEPLIAAALVKLGEGRKEKPSVKLGGDVHKAQRSKDGSQPPRLVKVAALSTPL